MPATTVKERPILFKGRLVRAILDGRKTQTRRVVRPQPERCVSPVEVAELLSGQSLGRIRNPYGVPGDRLWVRETWAPHPNHPRCRVAYRADQQSFGLSGGWASSSPDAPDNGIVFPEPVHGDSPFGCRWRPSTHMPRWASRILLQVTSVRFDRVQNISEDDAIAEGAEATHSDGTPLDPDPTWDMHRESFSETWDAINAKRGYSWKSNPWVWVIEFRRVEP